MPRTLKELLNTFFLTLQKKTLLSTEVLDICTRAGPKTLPKKVQKNSNGVAEGSHSRPPGRSKSMVFERILAGRKVPSDVSLGPPRCLGAAPCSTEQTPSYHNHHRHHCQYHHLLPLQCAYYTTLPRQLFEQSCIVLGAALCPGSVI